MGLVVPFFYFVVLETLKLDKIKEWTTWQVINIDELLKYILNKDHWISAYCMLPEQYFSQHANTTVTTLLDTLYMLSTATQIAPKAHGLRE